MRTTVRLDDDLLRELKVQAHKEGVSLAKLFERTVRLGLQTLKNGGAAHRKPYREKTFSTGVPFIDLTKTSQILAEMDNEEFIRKMQSGR